MNQSKLARDLQKAGASKRQARDLSEVAGKINNVDIPHLSGDAKARIASEVGFGYNPNRRVIGYAWKGAAAFAILLIIVLAQPAKPGSALYSVKRGTDRVKIFLQDVVPFIGDDNDTDDDRNSSQQSERRSGSSSIQIEDSGRVDSIFDDNADSNSGTSDDVSGSGSNSGSSGSSGSTSTSSTSSGSNTSGSTSGGSGSTSGGSGSGSSGGGSTSGGGGSGGGHSGGIDDNPTP